MEVSVHVMSYDWVINAYQAEGYEFALTEDQEDGSTAPFTSFFLGESCE